MPDRRGDYVLNRPSRAVNLPFPCRGISQSRPAAFNARSKSPACALAPMPPMATVSDDQPNGLPRSGLLTGDYLGRHAVPRYRALNTDQAVRIAGHSAAPDPQAIVARDVTISSESGPPLRVHPDTAIGRLVLTDPVSFDPRAGSDGSPPLPIGVANR